jgi:hypothetical protein
MSDAHENALGRAEQARARAGAGRGASGSRERRGPVPSRAVRGGAGGGEEAWAEG